MAHAKSYLPILTLGLGLAIGFIGKAAIDSKGPKAENKPGLPEGTAVTRLSELPTSGTTEASDKGAVASAVAGLEEKLQGKDQLIAQLQKDLTAKNTEIARQAESEKLPPVDDTPEERERLASEMLDLTNSKEQIEQAFAQVSKTMIKDADPDVQESLNKILNTYYSWDVMGKTFVKIYSDVFAAEDLQKINRFYHTEPGQMLLEKQPELMQKTLTAIQEINQKSLPQISQEMQKIAKKDKAPATGSGTQQVGR